MHPFDEYDRELERQANTPERIAQDAAAFARIAKQGQEEIERLRANGGLEEEVVEDECPECGYSNGCEWEGTCDNCGHDDNEDIEDTE